MKFTDIKFTKIKEEGFIGIKDTDLIKSLQDYGFAFKKENDKHTLLIGSELDYSCPDRSNIPFVAFKRVEVKESLSDYLTRAYPNSNLLELIINESKKDKDVFLKLSLPEQYYYSLIVMGDSDYFEDDMIKDEYEMDFKD